MTKIEAEIHEDAISIINKVSLVNDEGIDLILPEGSIIFDNVLNLKLIKKEAEGMGKTLHFVTTDEAGISLIALAEGERPAELLELERELNTSMPSTKIPIPSISLPKVSLPSLKLIPLKGPVVIGVIVLGVILGGVAFATNAPKANIKIVVESQPLTKSFEISVKKDASSSAESMVLRGINIETDISGTAEIETTGEKMIGEKAEGEIKIFNFTSEEKTFKKGAIVEYDDLEYVLDESVTVPAQTVDTTAVPPDPTPGEEKVTATASEIGDKYNISKNKSLDVKGYKNAQFTATTISDIDGGESKKVRVVAKEDLASAAEKVTADINSQSQNALNTKVGRGQKLVNGAVKSATISETYSAKEGDEAEKLALTRTVKMTGLVYSTEDLDKLLDSLVKQLVPEGYKLSEKERTTGVEVLGNSNTTILSTDEADIQTTLKAFVIPDITEDAVKEGLAGKSLEEAQKFLGSIRNVKTYEMDINPRIPLISKVPGKVGSINVEITINE